MDHGLLRQQLVTLLPRLRRFALVLSRSADSADDLVQASVERALTRLDHWEPGTHLDRWLFSIVKSVWLNNQRSAKIRRAEPIEAYTDEWSSDGARDAEARLTLAEVREAFGRLPEEQRQALFLVSVEGYTYAEAAEILGIPIGTVISRLARGRAALMSKTPIEAQPNVTLFKQKSNLS